jgi:Domain of unknown function (DUF4864)
MIKIFFAAVLSFGLLLAMPARAQTEAEKSQFRDIISGQIAAFNKDDGNAAYGFAAPIVKKYFPTMEVFIAMVKQGYPQVYRAQSISFGDVFMDNFGRPTQRVTLVGPDGKRYEALYAMEMQKDGTWKIAACTVLPIAGLDA